MKILFAVMSMVLLAACAPDAPTVPCPVCFEDAWSKEPFTGQPKQHSKALTPEELQANGLGSARSMIGTVSPSQP